MADIKFRINTGDHKGDEYRYTLAVINGKKAWRVKPSFDPPPDIYKERIDMVIECREQNVSKGGATELRTVSKVLDELSHIATEVEPVTLTGLTKASGKKGEDNKERLVQIDSDGFGETTELNEDGREPEYRIELTCWGIYD